MINTIYTSKKTALKTTLRFLAFTDTHHSPTRLPYQDRHPIDAIDKINKMIDETKFIDLDFMVEIGDLCDSNTNVDLITILDVIKTHPVKEKLYVTGNHDYGLKSDWLTATNLPRGYYSKIINGFKIIVLDMFDDGNGEGNQPSRYGMDAPQIEWLHGQMNSGDEKILIFSHLKESDIVGFNLTTFLNGYRDKVIGVFSGHKHLEDFQLISGVNHYNLDALTDGAYPIGLYYIFEIDENNNVSYTVHGES